MFTDHPVKFSATGKTACSTQGVFNKIKGALSTHKESGIRSYFNDLLPNMKKGVIDAYRQNSKSHQIHGHEIEDNIKAKIKAYEKKQKEFEKKQNKLASLNKDDEKYPKAEEALEIAASKVADARQAISNLLEKNPVEMVRNMFDETVKLGSQTATNQLKDIESKIESIISTVIPAEESKRQKDKQAAITSVQGVVDQARKIVGV